ncbi:hypothetical protein DPMN_043546 [Dreissena polymorpha]|uniref:Uncharacterized protein n=1 Tax=Dreissena polymorpha TaxID=45954 RepID=A0A9D4D2X1_DREPO|nr:hypothetical protein DPMN_043546 [Dreissena polymorpha]
MAEILSVSIWTVNPVNNLPKAVMAINMANVSSSLDVRHDTRVFQSPDATMSWYTAPQPR